MCGISGVYTQEITDKHIKIVNAIVQSQFNRGPDHQAIEQVKSRDATALLGHNRLSIIDLSENANQPMWDATRRYCIVYNGEIYNYIELRIELKNSGYTFNTTSDTEVILNAFALWGIDALNRFQGPFAFALFDTVTSELWLCRDRFGVRPLYYIKQNNVIYFASTTTALAKELSLKPDLSYISRGLKHLVYEDGSESTPYQHLVSLPASSYLYCKISTDGALQTQEKKYYDLTLAVKNLKEIFPVNDTEYLLDLIETTLEQAVKIRLRSDVPLGISLSSGLDSSAVAALVNQNHKNTIGFSFGHPDNKETEGPLVHKSAKYMNLQIEYVWPTADEMIAGLFKAVDIQDAPFSSLSIVAHISTLKKFARLALKYY